jgi:hypothetical protein
LCLYLPYFYVQIDQWYFNQLRDLNFTNRYDQATEVLLKWMNKYSWPPCTNLHFILKIVFTLFTKQATLMRRSIVPILPSQLIFPDKTISNNHFARSFCQLATWSTCCLINLPFHWIAVLTKWHFTDLQWVSLCWKSRPLFILSWHNGKLMKQQVHYMKG